MFYASTALATGPNPTGNPDAEALAKVLRGCEARVTGCEAYRQAQDAALATQLELIGKQSEQLRATAATQNTTGNPLLWFIAGMLVTGITVKLVK